MSAQGRGDHAFNSPIFQYLLSKRYILRPRLGLDIDTFVHNGALLTFTQIVKVKRYLRAREPAKASVSQASKP